MNVVGINGYRLLSAHYAKKHNTKIKHTYNEKKVGYLLSYIVSECYMAPPQFPHEESARRHHRELVITQL